MEIRGERECTECGTRWSYYTTGEVSCPECGSLKSVGREERALHTDSPVELDLTTGEELLDQPLSELATEIRERCRSYVRQRGFVNGGTLRTLDDDYLIAQELITALGAYERSLSSGALDSDVDDVEQLYLLELLDRERPPPSAVPESLASERGLAYATAASTYREDVVSLLDTREESLPPVRRALGRLDDHVRRVEALDGDIEPRTAESLVEIARDLGRAVDGDETALARTSKRLDELG
ncbi:DUF7117 family protein [Halalkalicoccus subterraneus]|uniref:DUF7117 family protein n=1 Tax=Halalkalicoccus subterraneus TaxID=2675002 RepID=UPI000EFA81BF|nr:hypothetical protein [Halalkalicoccus subterraneus]